jgi:hypothetical protein
MPNRTRLGDREASLGQKMNISLNYSLWSHRASSEDEKKLASLPTYRKHITQTHDMKINLGLLAEKPSQACI